METVIRLKLRRITVKNLNAIASGRPAILRGLRVRRLDHKPALSRRPGLRTSLNSPRIRNRSFKVGPLLNVDHCLKNSFCGALLVRVCDVMKDIPSNRLLPVTGINYASGDSPNTISRKLIGYINPTPSACVAMDTH